MAEHLADEELSIGDFVLSGGELGAALVLDCVARLLPGVLGQRRFGRSRNPSASPDCWIARNTPAPPNSAAGRFQKYY